MSQVLKRLLAIAVLALFLVALWPLFQGVEGNLSSNAIEESVSSAVESPTVVTESQSPEVQSQDKSPEPGAIPTEVPPEIFQKAYQECASDIPGAPPETLSELVFRLDALSRGSAPEKQWENYRFRLPSGEERRVMVVPSDGQESKGQWALRLFGVDKESLPIPLTLPGNIAGVRDLDRLLSMGQVFDHQISEIRDLGEGEQLLTERHNGKAVDFQWRRPKGSLVCSTSDCRCLKGMESR